MRSRRFLAPAAVPTLLAAASLALAVSAQADAVPAAGRVVFVSGNAQISGTDGMARAVHAGTEVRAGERIATGDDTYVHLRMVDRAFVALRPQSTFVVELYEYDAARPQDSRIRLQLDEGNARTVSGQGGEAARDRYRFGTPVAAIGLRGTDYTVRTTGDATRVSVVRGAVVVTPLGSGCSADSLGPCHTLASRELSAGLPHAYLEVTARDPLPVLVAPEQDPAGAASQNPPGAPDEPRSEESGSPPASAKAPIETIGEVNADRVLALAPDAPPGIAPEPPVAPVLPPVVTNPGAETSLVWGRWSHYATGDGSPALVTLLSPKREVLYGNEVFALLRNREGRFSMPAQGVADFRFDAGEAYAVRDGVATAAAVLGGEFSVDFRQREFRTELSVHHGSELERLHARGSVQFQGLLVSDPARSSMTAAGALANDLQSAAYLFEKPVTGGSLLGAARWTR
ncbi:MAG TPA: FecR domain-containing protein [Zeimonas sp.]